MSALSHRKRYLFAALLLSVITLLPGCAAQRTVAVWHSGDQFVSIVDRDDLGGAQRVPNRHPVSLAGRELMADLGSLAVKLPGDTEPTAVFGKEELAVLSEQLHAALERAGKDQDVVFAVLGEKPLWKLIGSTAVVTTARVFYQDNGLNVIFGKVREDVHGSDRRLDPFAPGSRRHASPLPGQLSTGLIGATHLPDRPDWFVFAPGAAGSAQTPVPAATVPTPVAPAAASSGGQVPPAPSPDGAAATPAAKSIEERLRTLEQLKAKGLITDEEYRSKRRDILNEL